MKEPKYIYFEKLPNRDGRTTMNWAIRSKSNKAPLGRVEWYSPWRRYCFEGFVGATFDEICLRDIAAFCEKETARRKENAKTTQSE